MECLLYARNRVWHREMGWDQAIIHLPVYLTFLSIDGVLGLCAMAVNEA